MNKDPDADVEAVVAWIRGQGFELVEEQYSEHAFGNWSREFHGPDFWIRIVRDRSEWFIEATTSGSSAWFSMNAWSDCLRNGQVVQGTSPQAQAEFLRQNLRAMLKAAGGDRSLPGCLEIAEREILAAQVGRLPNIARGQTLKLAPPADGTRGRQEAAARLARERRRRRKK